MNKRQTIGGLPAKEYQRAYMKGWRELHPDAKRTWERANPAKHLITAVRYRAKKLGVPFNLKAKDIEIPERCPVLDIPLRIFPGDARTRPDDSISLDRLIPNLGYVRGNVRVISLRANRLKNNATREELIMLTDYVRRERVQS